MTINAFSGGWFFDIVGYFDGFKFGFLAFTAYIGVIYVSVDALIAVKVGFAGLYGYFLMSLINLVYMGPRPFWTSPSIVAPVCVPTFSHPSSSTFIL